MFKTKPGFTLNIPDYYSTDGKKELAEIRRKLEECDSERFDLLKRGRIVNATCTMAVISAIPVAIFSIITNIHMPMVSIPNDINSIFGGLSFFFVGSHYRAGLQKVAENQAELSNMAKSVVRKENRLAKLHGKETREEGLIFSIDV